MSYYKNNIGIQTDVSYITNIDIHNTFFKTANANDKIVLNTSYSSTFENLPTEIPNTRNYSVSLSALGILPGLSVSSVSYGYTGLTNAAYLGSAGGQAGNTSVPIWNISTAATTAPDNVFLWFYYSFNFSGTITNATIYAAVDDQATIYINNVKVSDITYSSSFGVSSAQIINNVTLVNGTNYIKVAANNNGGQACLILSIYNGSTYVTGTNTNWKFAISKTYNTLPDPFNIGSTSNVDISTFCIAPYIEITNTGSSTITIPSWCNSITGILIGGGGGGTPGNKTNHYDFVGHGRQYPTQAYSNNANRKSGFLYALNVQWKDNKGGGNNIYIQEATNPVNDNVFGEGFSQYLSNIGVQAPGPTPISYNQWNNINQFGAFNITKAPGHFLNTNRGFTYNSQSHPNGDIDTGVYNNFNFQEEFNISGAIAGFNIIPATNPDYPINTLNPGTPGIGGGGSSFVVFNTPVTSGSTVTVSVGAGGGVSSSGETTRCTVGATIFSAPGGSSGGPAGTAPSTSGTIIKGVSGSSTNTTTSGKCGSTSFTKLNNGNGGIGATAAITAASLSTSEPNPVATAGNNGYARIYYFN